MAASILTNSSAMVALSTLRATNNQLETVTTQISTGKKVGAAKDNAAVFAISAVMKSDVTGFKAISESLSLGASTLAVASKASESIESLLNEIKGKIISANEDNVDRTKLQNEIVSLRDQISGIVTAAQFNGLNLIDGSTSTFSTLSSLDRASDNSVSTSNIEVDTTATNLATDAGTDLLGSGVTVDVNDELSDATTGANVSNIAIVAVQEDATTPLGAIKTSDAGADTTDTAALLVGDRIEVRIGTISAAYQVREGDEIADVASGLRLALVDAGIDQTAFTLDSSTTAGTLTVTNNSEIDTDFVVTSTRGSGGLSALTNIDVSDAAGAASALTDIENLIQTTIDAQATLGVAEKRVDLQSEFITSLTDAFNSGIGGLVDADLEAASARLQALQVQQQLGIQALSIANQQPQNILALFR